MEAGDPAGEARTALAREAEPLRQSLAGYFRSRVNDGSEVDDLVQEVFARLLSRDSSARVEHLEAYVFQTAGNVLADRGRRRKVRLADAHVAFDQDRHAQSDPGPEGALFARERLRTTAGVLMLLPERTRTVFILHRLEGRRYRDIAAQLGVSVSAVEKHMVRAVQHLMQHLGEDV